MRGGTWTGGPGPCARRLLAFGALLLAACASITPETPQGFAPYKVTMPFRAVSPDGVMYRVRMEDNEPEAQLPFWKEALKKRMIDAGYKFMAESDLEAGGQPGYLLELAAPLGTQDYTYLVAVFVHDRQLVIVESAGEVTRFKARRDAVVDAIRKIRF